MKLFKFFEPEMITLRFNSVYDEWAFENDGYVEDDYCDGVIEIVGGFEDKHVEVTYPIRWNKVKDFKRYICSYNKYANHFKQGDMMIKVLG